LRRIYKITLPKANSEQQMGQRRFQRLDKLKSDLTPIFTSKERRAIRVDERNKEERRQGTLGPDEDEGEDNQSI